MGVIVVLYAMDPKTLHPAARIKSTSRQLRAGLSYARRSPVMLASLLMTLIIGIFTYEYPVTLPALAKITFMGSAATLALLTSAYALGGVTSGLVIARDKAVQPSTLPARATVLGLAGLLLAIQPTFGLALVAAFLFGFAVVRISAYTQTILQLNSDSAMRGRMLALFTSAWVGSSAIGGPIIGWVAQAAGPRTAVAVGGIAALVAAGAGLMILKSGQVTAS